VLHSILIRIDGERFATLAKQVDEIPPEAAAGVEHPHSWRDVSAQNLIEEVDVNLAELFLKRRVPKLLLHPEFSHIDVSGGSSANRIKPRFGDTPQYAHRKVAFWHERFGNSGYRAPSSICIGEGRSDNMLPAAHK